MSAQPIVIPPGQGHRLGNVEFLARTVDTPRFNFQIIEIAAGRALEPHVHREEDDAFFVLEGAITFTVDGEEVVAGAGTFVLVPPGVPHTFANRSDAVARFVNVHAPAGFDIQLESD